VSLTPPPAFLGLESPLSRSDRDTLELSSDNVQVYREQEGATLLERAESSNVNPTIGAVWNISVKLATFRVNPSIAWHEFTEATPEFHPPRPPFRELLGLLAQPAGTLTGFS